MAYSEQKTIADVNEAMLNCETLYISYVVNRIGMTSDTKTTYTEIAARTILEQIDKIKSDKSFVIVSREKPYRVKGHRQEPFDPNPDRSRKEERLAKSLVGFHLNQLGTVLDYQVPLYAVSKKVSGLRLGKIDMLALSDDKVLLRLIEYKWPTSKDTLLRCALEAYTYSRVVDAEKLCADFNCGTAILRPAVLVYESCQAYRDFHTNGAQVRLLMRKLCVDFFVLNVQHDKVIESHMHDTL